MSPNEITREQMVEWLKKQIKGHEGFIIHTKKGGNWAESIKKEINMFKAILSALEEWQDMERIARPYAGEPRLPGRAAQASGTGTKREPPRQG